MKKVFKFLAVFLFLVIFNSPQTIAQRQYDIHWVAFDTKAGTPYSIFHPQEYLSERALARRARQRIKIDSFDLPVNPAYIKSIKDAGLGIHHVSKWLNGAAVIGSAEAVEKLKKEKFVVDVRPIGFVREGSPGHSYIGRRDYQDEWPKHEDYYGDSRNQIKMLNGHYLHQMGLRGESMHLGVFDGGWTDMRETPAFDSLFIKNQLVWTYDYVQNDYFVYEGSDHGRDVLSCMAANLPHLFVGTAPDAFYYLFKTEDDMGEFVVEEYNWVAAMEFADSIGVELVNSSLGYYDFEDNEMDYAYKDLDGNTTVITRMADMAAAKGIMVVTSAGNEGDSKWKHISVPGDADSVLTVGAVDRDGYHAKFSSYGFDKHYLIKPNVMARGHMAIVAAVGRYGTKYQFGTSFSSPIMAGAVASLWQGLPFVSNVELIRALERHGSRAEKPDTQYGYGAPDLFAIYKELSNGAVIELKKKQPYVYHPHNPNALRLHFVEESAPYSEVNLELYNAQGQLLEQKTVLKRDRDVWSVNVEDWQSYPKGVYIAYIKLGYETKRVLLVK